jgi:hypothetical protein
VLSASADVDEFSSLRKLREKYEIDNKNSDLVLSGKQVLKQSVSEDNLHTVPYTPPHDGSVHLSPLRRASQSYSGDIIL